LQEHKPVAARSDELGGHALTHWPPAVDEHSALKHCDPALQAAAGAPKHEPKTKVCRLLGQVHALVAVSHCDGVGHEHAVDATAADVDPPSHAWHGALPPGPKNVAAHWHTPVDGATAEPDGQDDTHAPTAHRPELHVVPWVQAPPVLVTQVPPTDVGKYDGSLEPAGQEHRLEPGSHVVAWTSRSRRRRPAPPVHEPQDAVAPEHPLGATPHCASAVAQVRGVHEQYGQCLYLAVGTHVVPLADGAHHAGHTLHGAPAGHSRARFNACFLATAVAVTLAAFVAAAVATVCAKASALRATAARSACCVGRVKGRRGRCQAKRRAGGGGGGRGRRGRVPFQDDERLLPARALAQHRRVHTHRS